MAIVGSWSYSGDPSTSTRDAVRFTIGDTVEADPQLSDEEVDYLSTVWGSDPLAVSIQACRMLISRYTGQVNKRVLGLSIDYGDKVAQYRALLGTLQAAAAESSMVPVVRAATSKAAKAALRTGEIEDDPYFSTEMHDFVNTAAPQDWSL